jgi:hypothetical protein
MAEPEEENKYQNRSLGGEKTGNRRIKTERFGPRNLRYEITFIIYTKDSCKCPNEENQGNRRIKTREGNSRNGMD